MALQTELSHPVLYRSLKVAQHPGLEVAEVADFDRHPLLKDVAHNPKLLVGAASIKESLAIHAFSPLRSGINFSLRRIISLHVTTPFL